MNDVKTLIEKKVAEFDELTASQHLTHFAYDESGRGRGALEGAYVELKTFLTTSIKEAIALGEEKSQQRYEEGYKYGVRKGLELAEGAAEDFHKELNLRPRFPGGALEKQIQGGDKALHELLPRIKQLREELVTN